MLCLRDGIFKLLFFILVDVFYVGQTWDTVKQTGIINFFIEGQKFEPYTGGCGALD
jgi:hypothetical protein